jgi:hypothetical protein
MTGTPTPQPIITTGIEHNVVPGGQVDFVYNWADVIFDDLPKNIVLNGFKVYSRYYIETCTPTGNTDPNTGQPEYACIRSYPDWTVTEQTLVKLDPDRKVFTTDEGDELYAAEPGVYGVTEAGIKDGTKYGYVNVFDQADISYWPRASTPNQELITNPTDFPDDDEEYLIDTLTSFVPDPRSEVVITYQLTTTYEGGVDILNIYHKVTQNTDDVGDKIKAYLDRSYYTDGKYHIQLHDGEAPDLYDAGGKLIRPEDYKVPIYQEGFGGVQNLVNSVTPVTPDDILKETLNTSVEELEELIHMIDKYEFPE